jgi:hypothetical protein
LGRAITQTLEAIKQVVLSGRRRRPHPIWKPTITTLKLVVVVVVVAAAAHLDVVAPVVFLIVITESLSKHSIAGMNYTNCRFAYVYFGFKISPGVGRKEII